MTNLKDLNLTTLERAVLADLLASWDGNGGDFGFIEDITSVPMKRARGVVSSLVKKDLIVVHEATTTDSGTWTQFDFYATENDLDGRHLGEAIRNELRAQSEWRYTTD